MAKKRLTQREKKANAAFKKEMQEKGILPPDKPRLNREKYIKEAVEEWNGRSMDCRVWDIKKCILVETKTSITLDYEEE